jgi:hypothetical protein
MSTVFQELIDAGQERYRRLRQLTQFYHRFAGNLIRIQQDRDCVLTHLGSSGGVIELAFEERDEDGFVIQIKPFRNDLVFVTKVGFWAQVHFELFRFCLDPEKLQRVNSMHMKTQMGGLFGGSGTKVAQMRGSQATLGQPGVMKLRSSGSRIYVSTSLIWDLTGYAVDGGGFDRENLARDLGAVSHGLEKCLAGMSGQPQAS